MSADSVVPGAGALTVTPHDATAQAAWTQTTHGETTNPQALNRSSYGDNNPVTTADATGHCGGDGIRSSICEDGGGVPIGPSNQTDYDALAASEPPATAAEPNTGRGEGGGSGGRGGGSGRAGDSGIPPAVEDLLTRTKPYRGSDKDLDYTGSNTLEEDFNRVVEPDSVTPHKNPDQAALGGKQGRVAGTQGGTIGSRPTSRDTGGSALDLHNVPGLPKTTKIKWSGPQ